MQYSWQTNLTTAVINFPNIPSVYVFEACASATTESWNLLSVKHGGWVCWDGPWVFFYINPFSERWALLSLAPGSSWECGRGTTSWCGGSRLRCTAPTARPRRRADSGLSGPSSSCTTSDREAHFSLYQICVGAKFLNSAFFLQSPRLLPT